MDAISPVGVSFLSFPPNDPKGVRLAATMKTPAAAFPDMIVDYKKIWPPSFYILKLSEKLLGHAESSQFGSFFLKMPCELHAPGLYSKYCFRQSA
jgi:hypothetical protein